MDYGVSRIEEVKKLRDETVEKQKKAIEFSNAITELDNMLKQHANGCSMEGLYEKVPDLLKGYVELVYDLNNHPSFRFFEPLLYNSEFYNKNSQSLTLFISQNDERPFVLSTPRLNDPEVLHLDIPFDHKGIDELCKMKRKAGSIDEIAEKLGVTGEQRELFDTFLLNKHILRIKNTKEIKPECAILAMPVFYWKQRMFLF